MVFELYKYIYVKNNVSFLNILMAAVGYFATTGRETLRLYYVNHEQRFPIGLIVLRFTRRILQ